jgi:D-glycero-alpha-D-manno-heptose-7-phosphate kinase
LKRDLASSITNPLIDGWYQRAIDAGAVGGKLCGAGGGGFLLFVVEPDSQHRVREALSDLMEVPIDHEVHGSQIIVPAAG